MLRQKLPGCQLSALTEPAKTQQHCLQRGFLQVKDNGIVLFCYPKANTKGCTSQAVGLSEKADELAAAGYKVSRRHPAKCCVGRQQTLRRGRGA